MGRGAGVSLGRKALIIRHGDPVLELVSVSEAWALVDGGKASWPGGLEPSRPEAATAATRETPEAMIQPEAEKWRKRGRR